MILGSANSAFGSISTVIMRRYLLMYDGSITKQLLKLVTVLIISTNVCTSDIVRLEKIESSAVSSSDINSGT